MQQLVIENLELRVSSIASDLDAEEQAQLRADLKSLAGEYRTLCQGVRTYEQELDKAVSDRQHFEAQLDDTQRKLAALVVQSQGYDLLPLASTATEKLTEKFKVCFYSYSTQGPKAKFWNQTSTVFTFIQSLKQAVVDFESSEMNEFKKQLQNLTKTCNDVAKNELQEILQSKLIVVNLPSNCNRIFKTYVLIAMEGQLEELLASLNAMLSQFDDATRQRKELEGITEFCQHWFKQADINLAVEIRNSTSPEILVEHIMVVR